MSLQEYAPYLIFNVLLIFGIWKLFQPDMLLGRIGDWIDEKFPDHVAKPLLNCPPCMSSLYGTAFYWLSGIGLHAPLWFWPLHCLALCGAATIVMPHE